METTSNPTVSLFGIDFDLTILAMSLLTVIIVFGVVFWSSRDMTIKPKGDVYKRQIQLLVAILIFGETVSFGELKGFFFIWMAILVFVTGQIVTFRRSS